MMGLLPMLELFSDMLEVQMYITKCLSRLCIHIPLPEITALSGLRKSH